MLGMDNPESATVAILYQPDSLQARIDVPLEQAAGLFPGQPVWIRTNLLPDKQFRGKVDRIVGEADLQRNTLQAKVLLLDSDPRLRPEMLCRAEFLASSQGETNSVSSSTGGKKLLLFIPTAALTKRSGDEATVWVVDPLNPIIKSQVVRLGVEQRDGEQQITDGLRPGQKVVINPASDLQEGDRIVAKTTAQNEEPQ
jgi:multidrug efflux pump subunit AcrA (membrane-fusion protein)